MSAVKCYDKLVQLKNSHPPLSKAARCKLIIHHVLSTYDLVMTKDNDEQLLKSDTIRLVLVYHHVESSFRDRFRFVVTMSTDDEEEFKEFNVYLKVNIMPRMSALVYVRTSWYHSHTSPLRPHSYHTPPPTLCNLDQPLTVKQIPVQVPAIKKCFMSIDEIARIFSKSQSLYRRGEFGKAFKGTQKELEILLSTYRVL